jgi:hypothetical protein
MEHGGVAAMGSPRLTAAAELKSMRWIICSTSSLGGSRVRGQPNVLVVIDPQTGEHLRQVEKPVPGHELTLYLHNLALDAFFDVLWAFKEFLAHHPRPPFGDLVAFVVDGTIPQSMMPLIGPDLSRLRQAMQDYWGNWDNGEDGYLALLGRRMLREEKYWLVQTVGRGSALGSGGWRWTVSSSTPGRWFRARSGWLTGGTGMGDTGA